MAFTRRDRLTGMGDFVRWYMQKHDLSYAELASKMDCSKGWLSTITSDKYLFPQGFIERIKPLLTKEESEIMLQALYKDIKAWYEADRE